MAGLLDDGEVILLEFRNNKDDPVKLFVEPWCHELKLPKNVSLKFSAINPPKAKSTVTIEFCDDRIVVWGVPNAIMRLYADGMKIWECFEPFLLPEDIDPNDG